METYQKMRNMIDYFDNTSEKGRISYMVRRWEKQVNNINKKSSKPRLKMMPLIRALFIAHRHYLIILEDYIKL